MSSFSSSVSPFFDWIRFYLVFSEGEKKSLKKRQILYKSEKLAFSKLLHVAEEGGGEERQRLLAADTQEPFVVTTMNATEAMNRKVNVRGDDVDIEIPDTAHQISSGL